MIKKIGIIGCGAIGRGIAFFLEKELSKQALLTNLADKNKKAALSLQRKLKIKTKISTLKNLVQEVDLIIEAASQAAARQAIKEALIEKKDIVILSVGALIKNPQMLRQAEAKKIKIYVPSGAIAGLDGLAALAKGNLKKITITTAKPPAGLSEINYLKKKKIDLSKLKKPTFVFSGKAEEAIEYFPKNINVAATLLLASGNNPVEVTIVADPFLKKNTHRITAEGSEAKLKIEVENTPTKTNPKTSALTILSAQNLLEKIFSSIKIGS